MVDRYPTAAAFLAATRSGEIPEMLHDNKQNAMWVDIGRPLLNIMTKEYGLDIRDYYAAGDGFGLMLQNITDHEFDTDDKGPITAFQNNQKQMPEVGRKAFNKFAVQYVKALKEYIASKRHVEEQHEQESAEQQRQADLKERQATEEQRKHKEAMEARLASQKAEDDAKDRRLADEQRKQQELKDARQASLKAEDDIKAAAVTDAVNKAKEARKQKLAEIVASPAYKQWEAALIVQQGEKMISDAQSALDHDAAVQRESGVTNLAERRAAGEQMVAGKSLVETAFEAYKKQGGKAITPKDVVAGSDPAANYR